MFNISDTISKGIRAGIISKRSPGKIVDLRWSTTGNRALQLYLSTDDPSANLVTLVIFILKAYTPMWLTIKTKRMFNKRTKWILFTSGKHPAWNTRGSKKVHLRTSCCLPALCDLKPSKNLIRNKIEEMQLCLNQL